MSRGRPPLGSDIVEHCDADPDTKRRLRLLLQTLAGDLSVADACAQLGISQTRFFELRAEMLQGALDRLRPKPAGRPARAVDPAGERIAELEQQIDDLRVHLVAAQLREEIALAMPALARRRNDTGKKTTRRTAAPRTAADTTIAPPQHPAPSTDGSNDT